MTLPVIRLDFEGSHILEVAPPVAPSSAGPPLRLDFEGFHTAPVASSATPSLAGATVRLDFVGQHALDEAAQSSAPDPETSAPATPRDYPADFKAIVVFELLTGAKTRAHASRDYAVAESVLIDWTQQFIDRAPLAFQDTPLDELRADVRIAELERALGRMALELDKIKRALAFSRPPLDGAPNGGANGSSLPPDKWSKSASGPPARSVEKPRLPLPRISLDNAD